MTWSPDDRYGTDGERLQRSRALALAAAAVTVVLTALFLHRFAPARLILRETGGAMLAAAAVVLACFAVGWAVTRANFADAFLVGFPCFGTVVALVAWISVRPVPLLTHAAALAGLVLLWRTRPALPPRPAWL
ncbi:MAG TPA: hypothetical protein VJ276_12800, partial [Thermoanaerobaculia bacterium]|nr:hypothetical protein [Thermoanaerobaculia bacterium]